MSNAHQQTPSMAIHRWMELLIVLLSGMVLLTLMAAVRIGLLDRL